jgi:hypothetical protein
LKSFEIEEHKEDADCRLMSCVLLDNGKVLISATVKISDGSHTQQSYLFDQGRLIVRREPSLGLLGLHMISLDPFVYFINGQKCEKYDLDSNFIEKIEDLSFNHIKGGACRFNDKVIVISGINCKEIECLGIEQYWIRVASLQVSVFDFTCVQISTNEVLAVNNKRTYRINVETGTCLATASFRANVEVAPVKRGDFVFALNWKNQLFRYSLKDDRWSNLSRSGCCQVF